MNANVQSQEYENLQEEELNISPDIPNVYVRSAEKADKEIDLLWSEASQRNAHKEDRAPGVYLAVGFLAGLLVMFMMMSLLQGTGIADTKVQLKVEPSKSNQALSGSNLAEGGGTSATTTATQNKFKDYTIQEGDSLEKISRKFYGKYTPELVDKIQKANNLDSPHKIRAGKSLIIPL